MKPNSAKPQWTLPRAPLFRFCTLACRMTQYPDDGEGVWEITGYDNLDTPDEIYLLRRVMPARAGGPTGEFIKVWRHQHDKGSLRIWSANPEDPALNAQPIKTNDQTMVRIC